MGSTSLNNLAAGSRFFDSMIQISLESGKITTCMVRVSTYRLMVVSARVSMSMIRRMDKVSYIGPMAGNTKVTRKMPSSMAKKLIPPPKARLERESELIKLLSLKVS